MGVELAIGIDLGTTNSVVSVFQDGQARILPNRLGDLLTPSAVGFDPKGDGLLVGRAAKELLSLGLGRAAAFFKRDMGQDTTWRLGSETYGAIELSALVLRSLAEDAAAELGQPVQRCVITVPAYFDEEQRKATMMAGELAGLKVDRILNEPTAAAIAYGLHQADKEMRFMVFDLGGGTLDVCIMELFDGILQVNSTAGESWLGGEDFSRALAEHALKEIGIPDGYLVGADEATATKILRRAEIAKRHLSTEEEATIDLPILPGLTESEISCTLSRSSALSAWQPLLNRITAPMRSALRGAGLEPEELDAVILVGGATRMPEVRRMVTEFCGCEPLDVLDPDLSIAQGAAIQAALCLEDVAVEDIVVTDVLSHSIGVDVMRSIGGRYVDGYFTPVLHRNTTIPNSRTESFYTIRENQKVVEFKVYEGESRRIEGNRLLGELSVSGIPKGPAGQVIELTLTIDSNGLLEVEARIQETGESLAKVLQRSSKKFNESQLAQAKKRMARIKEDPLNRPLNRELLLRAERIWQDLQPEMAEEIAQAMDDFEAAISSRDPSVVLDARDRLRAICDAIDNGELW